MRMHEVVEHEYANNPVINAAIDSVNRAGFQKIIERVCLPQMRIPMSVVMPLGVDASFKELTESSGAVLQYPGFANRPDLPDRLVSMTLAATVLQKPVIGVPYPNRNWKGLPPPSYKWRGQSLQERIVTGIALLDEYSDQTLQEAVDTFAIGKVDFLGGSMGATQALSAAYMARQSMDVGGVSVAALSNNESRQVYTELLLRDFRKGFDHARREIMATNAEGITVQPLLDAFGISDKPKSALSEGLSLARYLVLDIFGYRLQNYDANMAFARTLAVPSSVRLLERLDKGDNPVNTHLGFFELDPVARPDAFLKLTEASQFSNVAAKVYPDKSHSSCVNPLIGSHIALQLLRPSVSR